MTFGGGWWRGGCGRLSSAGGGALQGQPVAIRWTELKEERGRLDPRPRGGKSRSPLEARAGLLALLKPGDLVIRGQSARPHWGEKVRARIEARGAGLRFLPPYSPDLNPIELAFAKLKTLLRKAAERTRDALWDRIGTLLKPSPRRSAPTISATTDMLQLKRRLL